MGVFYSTESGPPTDEAALKADPEIDLSRDLAALKQYAPQHNPLGTIPWITVGSLPNASYAGRSGHTVTRSALHRLRRPLPADGRRHGVPRQQQPDLHARRALLQVRRHAGERALRASPVRHLPRPVRLRAQLERPGHHGLRLRQHATSATSINYQESLGRVPNNRYQTTWAFFAQDTWKVHRRLTLDLGLRFYKWNPPLNGGGEASAFTYERYDPTWGGKPPVLFRPTSTAQGRRALNPLTSEILPVDLYRVDRAGHGLHLHASPITPADSLQDQWHRDPR